MEIKIDEIRNKGKIECFKVTISKAYFEKGWETIEEFTGMMTKIAAALMVKQGLAGNLDEAIERLNDTV